MHNNILSIIAAVALSAMSPHALAGPFSYDYIQLVYGEQEDEFDTEVDVIALQASFQGNRRTGMILNLGYTEHDLSKIAGISASFLDIDAKQKSYSFAAGGELASTNRTCITGKFGVAFSKVESNQDALDGIKGEQLALLIDSRTWLTDLIELELGINYSYVDVEGDSESGPGITAGFAFHLTHTLRAGIGWSKSMVVKDNDVEGIAISLRYMF